MSLRGESNDTVKMETLSLCNRQKSMLGIKMDDLDHSIHISEYDWTSFYEDSEECSLLQPSLAFPDNLSLSDSEDSENLRSVVDAGQQEPQGSTSNTNAPECSVTGCSTEEESRTGCVEPAEQLNQSDNVTTEAKKATELHLDGGNTAENTTEEPNGNVTNTLQTEITDVQASVQTESNTCDFESIHEPDPNVHNLNVIEPLAAEEVVAVSEDACCVPLRAEKERWFVTVNDSHAGQRPPAASVKKKRRAKKKRYKGDHRCNPGQEIPPSFESELSRDENESEGERSRQNSGGRPTAQWKPEIFLRGHTCSSTSGEEENVSLPPKENTFELTERITCESGSLADTFTAKDLSQSGPVESDGFEDGVEFFSVRSYDSESYLSAVESVEEPLHLVKDTETQANSQRDRETHPSVGVLSNSSAASDLKAYESDRASNEPAQTFPSAAQRADKMPDNASTCDDVKGSTVPCARPDALESPKHKTPAEVNIPASGGSLGDELGSPPLPAPGLNGTPRPVADSPETYAEAAGDARPVYAISAFWDDMEKLTINDILQLRMTRSPPRRETQETVKPNVDAPTHSSSLDTEEEYRLSDVGLMDISDTADSDYCTQPDESKRDSSSCDFSTSDFEDDYWQFISTSGNLSPDLCSQTQGSQRATSSPFEDDESTNSEGRETPVPLEDSDQELSEFEWPRQLTKSKSVCNIQILNREDTSLESLLSNGESNLFLSSHQSLEEDMGSDLRESLGTLTAAPILSNTDVLDEHYRISFPEVFEYFFMQDKVKTDSRCVAFYDPEGFSVASVFDYALHSFKDKLSWRSEGKRVPIFSCSHPTVRELTFPESDYVLYDASEEVSLSPIRVVSHSLIQPSDCGIVGSRSWNSLLSMRKICFHGKGSIWCRGSGVWVFPVEAEKTESHVPVVREGRVSSDLFQFRELAVQQGILDTMQTARREGVLSALKQSDMCLVCIAFASWVLTSSDPKSADTWKAALLANVSALSAIQYLRHYVKKKNNYS